MIKLSKIINKLCLDEDYNKLESLVDKNLFESYFVIGELLDPNSAFAYEGEKGWYTYLDSNNNTYFVRMAYNPVSNDEFFELKTGWLDENNKPHYDSIHPNSSVMDWDKRSDTVAKIFRDEIIPFFLNQNLCDILKILPLDIKRYQFSIRMANKFVPRDTIEIIEHKPALIILKKK